VELLLPSTIHNLTPFLEHSAPRTLRTATGSAKPPRRNAHNPSNHSATSIFHPCAHYLFTQTLISHALEGPLLGLPCRVPPTLSSSVTIQLGHPWIRATMLLPARSMRARLVARCSRVTIFQHDACSHDEAILSPTNPNSLSQRILC